MYVIEVRLTSTVYFTSCVDWFVVSSSRSLLAFDPGAPSLFCRGLGCVEIVLK